jgi:hypothetical protein
MRTQTGWNRGPKPTVPPPLPPPPPSSSRTRTAHAHTRLAAECDFYCELPEMAGAVVARADPEPGAGAPNAAVAPASPLAPNALRNFIGDDRIVGRFAEAGVKLLYDWQADCLRTPGVLDGRNLVYSAPTSGGKTLVSELLLVRHVLARRKVIFALPYKSLVAEKVAYLTRLLGHRRGESRAGAIEVRGFYGNVGGPTIPPGVHVAVCTMEKAAMITLRMQHQRRLGELGLVRRRARCALVLWARRVSLCA